MNDAPRPGDGHGPGEGGRPGLDSPARQARPVIERLGLAAIAVVLASLFGGVSAASWVGGEPFLVVMGGIGCVMTLWVGLLTLIRG